MKSYKWYNLCIEKSKLLKKYITIQWIQKKYNTKMNTILVNSKSSKTSDTHQLLFSLTEKINWKKNDKYVALSHLSLYYTWKSIKKSYKKNQLEISAPRWNEEFELLDRSYSISDILGYSEYL